MLKPVRRTRRVLPLIALTLLVAVNAALAALLLRSQSPITVQPASQLPFDSTSPTPSAATSPAPDEPPSDSPTSSPSSTRPSEKNVELKKVDVPTRLLLAASTRTAWRATAGDCKAQGRLERSSNGGRSWQQVARPALGPIVRLGVESDGNLYVIGGTGNDCSAYYIHYSADGSIAEQTGAPQGHWYANPADHDEIQGPGSANRKPCKGQHVVGLGSFSLSRALLSCTDGSVMVTTNSGKSWKKADEFVGTIAVGSGGGRVWTAGAGKNCDGTAVRSFSLTAAGKLSHSSSRCAPDIPLSTGRTAIDASGGTIWLWAGNKVQVSTDGGRTWKSR
jgi:hypothetical protein